MKLRERRNPLTFYFQQHSKEIVSFFTLTERNPRSKSFSQLDTYNTGQSDASQNKYFDRHATFSRAYLAPVTELACVCAVWLSSFERNTITLFLNFKAML